MCVVRLQRPIKYQQTTQVRCPLQKQDPPQSWYQFSTSGRQLRVRMRCATARHDFGPPIQPTDHMFFLSSSRIILGMLWRFPSLKCNSPSNWLHCQGNDEVVPVHVVKGYGKVGAKLHLFLTSALDWGCADSFTARSLCPLNSQLSLPTECETG
jgi:hypothetical protein